MKLELSKTKKRINLLFDYNEELIRFVKSIPGSKFDILKKTWSIPLVSVLYLPKHLLRDDFLQEVTPVLNEHRRYNGFMKELTPIHGMITNEEHGINYDVDSGHKYLRIIDDWEKYRNYRAKRTRTLLSELNSPDIFVVIFTENLFKNGMAKNAFTALRAIGHPVAYDRSWYEQRYCDPKRTKFQHRNIDGFSNKEELKELLAKVVTDPKILE